MKIKFLHLYIKIFITSWKVDFIKTYFAQVNSKRNLESCLRKTANVNLHHVTKFSLYLSFTYHTEISEFMPVSSLRIVIDNF